MLFLHVSLQFQATSGLVKLARIESFQRFSCCYDHFALSEAAHNETESVRRFSVTISNWEIKGLPVCSNSQQEQHTFAAVKGSRVYLSDASSSHHDNVRLPRRVESFCLIRSRIHGQPPAFAFPGSSFWRPALRGTNHRCWYGWLRGPL